MFSHKEKEELFRKVIGSGNLRHSYLFFGDEGVGKYAFARGLANFIETGSFDKIEGFLIDVRVFEPDEKGTIGIEEALNIRSFLWETPLKSKRRFAIVNGADSLTFQAQSALLKVVEESPEFSLIVFIAKNAEVFLPPLASRLIKIHFGRLPNAEVIKILVSAYGVEKKRAEAIAKVSFGRISRALSLLGIIETKKTETSLLSKVVKYQIALWSENVVKNSKKLKILLEAEEALNRYNLNEGLQKKALEYKLRAFL